MGAGPLGLGFGPVSCVFNFLAIHTIILAVCTCFSSKFYPKIPEKLPHVS